MATRSGDVINDDSRTHAFSCPQRDRELERPIPATSRLQLIYEGSGRWGMDTSTTSIAIEKTIEEKMIKRSIKRTMS